MNDLSFYFTTLNDIQENNKRYVISFSIDNSNVHVELFFPLLSQ